MFLSQQQLVVRILVFFLLAVFSLPIMAAHIPYVVPTTVSGTHPYNLTGMIVATEANSMGTGTVVRYPKVVISCAHVVYDYGWRNGNYFVRGWNLGTPPTHSDARLLRGYWNFSSYSGPGSNEAYRKDFVAHYGYEELAGGSYGAFSWDGASAVQSSRSKMMVGYPAGLYPEDHVNEYRMHQTGPFNLSFFPLSAPFFGVEEVSAGPGNSGGPVWVNEGGQWLFSGILLGGFSRTLGDPYDKSGIYAMDAAAWNLVDQACISAGGFTPHIVSHPANVYTYLTQTATLTATAAGTPTPYVRWQMNSGGGWVDLNDGGGYSGTGTTQLKVFNITPAHGSILYRLSAMNIAATVYSTPAQIFPVAPPAPTITKQPIGQTVVVGSDVVLSVTASGIGNLSYQWRKDGVNLPGATGRIYGIGFAQTNRSGNYRVIVSNQGGSVLSKIAVVTVLPRFFLETSPVPVDSGTIATSPEQPIDGYISGTAVTLTVTPSGTNQFFGWSGQANGTSNVLTFTMNNHKTVRAHFGDSRLVLQHTDGRLQTWFMDGTNFLGATVLRKVGPGWRMAAAHDFNADNSHDFLLQHTDSRVAVWKMEKNNLSEAVLVRKAGVKWRAVAVADFNGDQQGDILFQHADNRLAVWYLNGTTFTNAAFIRGGVPIGPGWKAIAAHDFDTNGSPDIIFQHNEGGKMAIWLLEGTNLLGAVKVRDGLNSGNWKLTGLADFDDDKKDLVMLNTDGRTAIWFMDGAVYTAPQILRNGVAIGRDWKIVGTK